MDGTQIRWVGEHMNGVRERKRCSGYDAMLWHMRITHKHRTIRMS